MPITTPDHWTSGYVEGEAARIYYRRTGSGKPPLLAIHGFSDSGLSWYRVALGLQDGFDVIAVDARGHGRTTTNQPAFTLSDVAEDVALVSRSLDLAPAVVIGHSMGGLIAAELAARHPSVVRRLILEDPPFEHSRRLGATPLLTAFLWASKVWVRPLSADSVDLVANKVHGSWAENDRKAWAEGQVESAKHSARQMAMSLERNRDWLGILAEIDAPTLLLTSDNGVIKAAEAQAILAALPHGRQVNIADAGHQIRRDNFADFMAAVTEFARD